MRRLLSFDCEGAALVATLDEGFGSAGLLIVSGGNEIRMGAHRGMARLAAALAAVGHPVFRFDRRGVGDSEGENGGFESAAPDIAAAVKAFRTACPGIKRVIAFGNCDAATALALHDIEGIDALVLANPWVIEREDDLPPAAAIRARYASRLRHPQAWRALLSGAVDLRRLARGVARAIRPVAQTSLGERVGQALAGGERPVHILVCKRDATAIAFLDQWQRPAFKSARANANIQLESVDSASHSFAGEEDFEVLKAALLRALRG